MTVIPIASSSKGNAYAVIEAEDIVLIDCGISLKSLRQKCSEHGIDLNSAKAVLLTHDHSDHVAGLAALLNRFDLPVYANYLTAGKVSCNCKIDKDSFVCFENGQDFEIGTLKITPFSTPHDAADPVGYFIEGNKCNYFHATDIGTPLDSIGRFLSAADIATLESNHDPVMLENSDRVLSLKRRISGPRGHLSNDDAAKMIALFATPRLKKLFLAHLSNDCNSPLLAERIMRQALEKASLDKVELQIIAGGEMEKR